MKETNILEKQRFAFVLNFLRETKFVPNQVVFCSRLGIRKTFFYDINRKVTPKYMNIQPVLIKVKYEFPFVNDDWVRTGIGCVFITDLLPKKDIDYQYYIDRATKLFKEPSQLNLSDLLKRIEDLENEVEKLKDIVNKKQK